MSWLKQEEAAPSGLSPNQFQQQLKAAQREQVEQLGLDFVLPKMTEAELRGAEEIPLFEDA